MAVASREQLKQYALRALGAPVLEINVDDAQLEDRLDEALEYWNLYHYEGVEQMYLKHRIRASTLNLQSNNGTDFVIAEIVTGSTSGAKAQVIRELRHQELRPRYFPFHRKRHKRGSELRPAM